MGNENSNQQAQQRADQCQAQLKSSNETFNNLQKSINKQLSAQLDTVNAMKTGYLNKQNDGNQFLKQMADIVQNITQLQGQIQVQSQQINIIQDKISDLKVECAKEQLKYQQMQDRAQQCIDEQGFYPYKQEIQIGGATFVGVGVITALITNKIVS